MSNAARAEGFGVRWLAIALDFRRDVAKKRCIAAGPRSGDLQVADEMIPPEAALLWVKWPTSPLLHVAKRVAPPARVFGRRPGDRRSVGCSWHEHFSGSGAAKVQS